MGRPPQNPRTGIPVLKKGHWTPEEDQMLVAYIHKHGCGNWKSLPEKAGLNRCGKSCRLRWANYLRPNIKRGDFSAEEEQTIIDLHSSYGNKWSMIASHLPQRTDNEIKNFWNTHIKKKLIRSGVDPVTHQLIPDSSFGGNLIFDPLGNLAMIRLIQNVLQILNSNNPNLLGNLAMIRLIQNILQILNSNNPNLPHFLGESETLNQFTRPASGILAPLQTTIPYLENGHQFGVCHQHLSEASRMMLQVSPGGAINDTTAGNNGNEEYGLPGLVPAEIYTANELANSASTSMDYNQLAAMDDEGIDSYWREVLNESLRASSSQNF